MKHAGVAVTVTTFTDVIAFLVGSNTLLPVLQSFCVYAAISIFTIYALQVTHFVAWFSLGKMVVIILSKSTNVLKTLSTLKNPKDSFNLLQHFRSKKRAGK